MTDYGQIGWLGGHKGKTGFNNAAPARLAPDCRKKPEAFAPWAPVHGLTRWVPPMTRRLRSVAGARRRVAGSCYGLLGQAIAPKTL
jgi:hypothetical protein